MSLLMYKLLEACALGDINAATLPSSGDQKHISSRAQILVKPPGRSTITQCITYRRERASGSGTPTGRSQGRDARPQEVLQSSPEICCCCKTQITQNSIHKIKPTHIRKV